MNRKWLFLGTGVLIGGLLVGAATTPIAGAPPPKPKPVQVTNFPNPQIVSGTVQVSNLPASQAVTGTVNVGNLPTVQSVAGTVQVGNFPSSQAVSGTVNVGNFPAIQTVTGQVTVDNLPTDGNGNLRVAAQSQGAATSTDVELRILQSNSVLIPASDFTFDSVFLPVIQVPPGFNRVSISVQSLDLTKTEVEGAQAGFGTLNSPLVHVPNVGDLLLFPFSGNLDSGPVSQSTSGFFRVEGSLVQVSFAPFLPGVGLVTPPPDTEYYVHLHFSSE